MNPSTMLGAARRGAVAALALALVLAAPAARAAEPEKKPEKETEDLSKVSRATLADKIAPVSGNLWTKKGRFEITPNIGFSLADAFYQKYAFGLKLNYHLVETFAIGLHFSYALSTPGGAVNVCKATGCGSPTGDDLQAVPGKLGVLGGLDLAWSPIYGKVNVLAEKVLHFDLAIIAGVDVIQYMAPPAAGGTTGENTFTIGGHVGFGERFFITPSVVLRVELRDYLYSGKTVMLGTSDSKLENQLMLDIGVSFFVGGSKD